MLDIMPQKKLRKTPEEWAALGEMLSYSRSRVGLTQAEAATATGMSRNQIAAIEQGSRRATATELRALFAIYGLSDDADPRPWPDIIAELQPDDEQLLRQIASIMLADTRSQHHKPLQD